MYKRQAEGGAQKRSRRSNPSSPYLFRDYFQVVAATTPSAAYEGYRIFPDPSISYSGNARIFRNTPQPAELAFYLKCVVYLEGDAEKSQLQPCRDCRTYFEMKNYFKATPEAKDRILHVKSSKSILIQNSTFHIPIRIMCASSHHSDRHFTIELSLTDHAARPVMTSRISFLAKQWKRSGEPLFDLSCQFTQVGS